MFYSIFKVTLKHTDRTEGQRRVRLLVSCVYTPRWLIIKKPDVTFSQNVGAGERRSHVLMRVIGSELRFPWRFYRLLKIGFIRSFSRKVEGIMHSCASPAPVPAASLRWDIHIPDLEISLGKSVSQLITNTHPGITPSTSGWDVHRYVFLNGYITARTL